MKRNGKKSKKIILAFGIALLCSSMAVMPVRAELDIREGAANDEAYSLIRDLERGTVEKELLQEILDAGGFTGEAAEQVRAAIAATQQSQPEMVTGQEETPTPEETTQNPELEKTATAENEEVQEDVHCHEYEQELTKIPTCTEAGVKTFICACGESYTEEISPTGHIEDEAVTKYNAGCTLPGKLTYSCQNCGELMREEEIPATGHTEGESVIIKTPTFFRKGQAEVRCNTCGALLETTDISIPAGYLIADGCIVLGILTIGTYFLAKKRRKRYGKK